MWRQRREFAGHHAHIEAERSADAIGLYATFGCKRNARRRQLVRIGITDTDKTVTMFTLDSTGDGSTAQIVNGNVLG